MVLKDVNAPARTRSAYMYFCEDRRKEMTNDNPDASMVEISAMLGKLWSETDEKERSPYVEQSGKSKARYEKAMETYKLTPEYAEFQTVKATHNLIAKYAQKLDGAKKKLFIKDFLPTQINLNDQAHLTFCLQMTTGKKWSGTILMLLFKKLANY
eukprot:UN22433